MFRWDNVGSTSIRLGERQEHAASPEAAMHLLMDACAVPIILHDWHRAGILGNATLISHRGRPWLLTAAHLLDHAPHCGNWLAPAREDGALLSLEGARVRRAPHLDLALIDLRNVETLPRLLRGRHALPLDEAAVPHGWAGEAVYAISGFPAAWSQFERGWLAAKRLTVLTRRARQARQRARHDRVYDYGHIAQRSDGEWIRTPALEGMSGAGIWALRAGGDGSFRARLAAVQSAFMHGRYLRGYDAQAALSMLADGATEAA